MMLVADRPNSVRGINCKGVLQFDETRPWFFISSIPLPPFRDRTLHKRYPQISLVPGCEFIYDELSSSLECA